MSRRGPLRRAFKRVRERLLDRLGLLYSDRFFAKSDRKKGDSNTVVAQTLIERFAPSVVVDLGCGNGYFLAALQREGCRVLGLERSAAGLAGCAERGVPALEFDIRGDTLPADAGADLCLCFEVAEHLRPENAARLVELVTSTAPRAIFTAAPPGQGGVGHFNEQPREYWLELFARHDWGLLPEVTADLAEQWRRAGVVSWLPDNLMVLERRSP